MNLLRLITVAALSLCATGASAQVYPELSKAAAVERDGINDVAIIVAIEDYLLLPDVTGAVRNANDWEVFFRHGLGVKNVHILVNDGASREDILDAAKRGLAEAKPKGRVWFVFIGHGAAKEDGSDGVLVGMDAKGTASSLDARGIRRTELLDLLATGRQRQTVAVLDACFSGRTPSGGALAPGVQPVVAVQPVKRADTVVFSAARGDQVAGALPNDSRPAFSYLLLGAFRGWADTPGNDGRPDGTITAAEANEFVSRQLRVIPGRTQVPDLAGDAGLHLVRGVREDAPDLNAAMSPLKLQPTIVAAKPVAKPVAAKLHPAITPSAEEDVRKTDPTGTSIYDSLTFKKREKLTRGEISSAVRAHTKQFAACSEKSGPRGTITLMIKVKPDGRVRSTAIKSSEHQKTEVGRCFEGAMKNVEFPPTTATEDMSIAYPFTIQ